MKLTTLFFKLYKRFFAAPIYFSKYTFLDLFCKNKVLIDFWCPPRALLKHYNWGDDINLILPELISGKKVIPKRFTLLARGRVNYLCVGSIVAQLSNNKGIIWGSGAISSEMKLHETPLKVCAVRGPLTRKFLIDQGVECPEVYGDPALLFPRYYHPSIVKKFRLGIIPHYCDKDNLLLKGYKSMKDVTILDIQNYGSWSAFIDRVNECEFILSSSLHGVILADAYGIANCWVEFSEEIDKSFKFQDYYLSVGKNIDKPFQIERFYSLDELLMLRKNWSPILFEADRLLAVCPFIQS